MPLLEAERTSAIFASSNACALSSRRTSQELLKVCELWICEIFFVFHQQGMQTIQLASVIYEVWNEPAFWSDLGFQKSERLLYYDSAAAREKA